MISETRPAGDEHDRREALVARSRPALLDASFAQTVRGWALGLALATVLAVPIGILLGSNDFAARALRVPIEFLRPIPSAALIPLLFLTLGTTLKSEIFLAAFGAFWPLLIQTMYGVRDVDPLALDTARSFGLGRFESLYRITLPSAVPYIAPGFGSPRTVVAHPRVHRRALHGHPRARPGGQLRAVLRPERAALRLALATGFLGLAIHFSVAAVERRVAALAPLAARGARVRRARTRPLTIGAEIAVPVALLAAWQVWTVQRGSQYFPRLSTILVEFRDLWLFSQFDDARRPEPRADRPRLRDRGRRSASRSASRSGSRAGTRSLAMPHIEYWRAMPPPALLPISIVLLHSIGNIQKVALHRLLLLLPDPAEHDRRRARHRADADRHGALVRHPAARADPAASCCPAAMPQIAAGMRNSLSLAVIIMVLAEYFSSTSGVGYVLLDLEEHVPDGADVGGDPPDRRCSATCSTSLFILAERRVLAWHRGWRAATPHDGAGDRRCSRSTTSRKTYGAGEKATQAIGDVSFTVEDRRVRLRRRPVGLRQDDAAEVHRRPAAADRGDVLLHGKPVTGPPEELALVFQEYSRSLMPWTSVRNNVLLPLRHKKLSRAERQRARRGVARGGRARRASSTTTRGSSPAGCSSASRSRARSPTSRRSC